MCAAGAIFCEVAMHVCTCGELRHEDALLSPKHGAFSARLRTRSRRCPSSAIISVRQKHSLLPGCCDALDPSEMTNSRETARYTHAARRRRRRRKFGCCRQFLNFRNELLDLHDFTSRFRNELLTPQRAISNAPNFTVVLLRPALVQNATNKHTLHT